VPQTVFVDDSGRRARLTRLMLRAVTGVLVIGVIAVLVSFVGGVPMPGVNPPVGLPGGEPAHPRTHGVPTPTATLRRPATSPTGRSGTPATASDVATPTSTVASARSASPMSPTSTSTGSMTPAGSSTSARPTGAHTTPPQRNTAHPTPSGKPTSP
jgi:hypothetical protein